MQLDKFQSLFVDSDLCDVNLVSANAGSGKTTTCVAKINKLVEDGVSSDDIVFCTFTNRMAQEIRRKSKHPVLVGTIHSIVYKKLSKHKRFSLLMEWDRTKLIRNILYDLGFSLKTKKEMTSLALKVMEKIDYCRANLLPVTVDNLEPVDMVSANSIEEIYNRYFSYKEENGYIDYDDLLDDHYLSTIPDDFWNKEYIFVDEAQDLSKSNFNVIDKFNGKKIFVYDLKQTLYSFRWAYTEPFRNPDKHFKSYRMFYLLNNYRSDPQIVNVFNTYAEVAFPNAKESIPVKKKSENKSVFIVTLESDVQVGSYIASEILNLTENGYGYKDISILVPKSSFIKSVIEPQFVSRNIPYKVRTPTYKKKFFETDVNKIILSLISYFVNRDIRSLIDVSYTLIGIGKATHDRFIRGDTSDDRFRQIESISKYIDEEGGGGGTICFCSYPRRSRCCSTGM